MSLGVIDHAMTYQMTEHWCNAVSPSTPTAFPSAVFAHHNVLQFAQAQDVWFTPDRDPNTGDILHNDRLEQFRLACLYDALSNMLDIGVNLDDDIKDTQEFIQLLTQHAGTGEPSNLMWLTTPRPYFITMRTLRLKGE